jgi:hypothetical protein
MHAAFISNDSKSGKAHARPQAFRIISFSQQLVKGQCFAFGNFKKERLVTISKVSWMKQVVKDLACTLARKLVTVASSTTSFPSPTS